MSKRANGEGTIYKGKDGKFYGEITLGYDANGKRIYKKRSAKTKAEVRKKLEQIKLGIYTGTYVDRSNVTVHQLGEQILLDDLNMGIVKESSFHRNKEALKRLAPISTTPIQKLTEWQLREFFAKECEYSQSVLNKSFNLMKRICKQAIKKGIIYENPMEDLVRPKSKKPTVKVRALTIGEQKKLIELLKDDSVKIQHKEQMLLSLYTGMRIGEINALNKSDVNLIFKRITINKTVSKDETGKPTISHTAKTDAGTRTVPMFGDTIELLKKCVNNAVDCERIFSTRHGEIVTASEVNMARTRLFDKYDIIDKNILGKVDTHSLRHTFATRCIESGMQPKVLQTLLGHTDISVTLNTYCDAFAEFQSQGIEQFEKYMRSLGMTENTPRTKTKSS